MAGGPGWTTFPEHAGQVPVVREHPTKEQCHHTLRHPERIKSQETRTNSQIPQRHYGTELHEDKISRSKV